MQRQHVSCCHGWVLILCFLIHISKKGIKEISIQQGEVTIERGAACAPLPESELLSVKA